MVVVVIYFSRVLLHMHCTEGPAILNGTVVLHRRLLFLQRSAASLIASRGLALFHRSQILFLKNSIAEGQNNTGLGVNDTQIDSIQYLNFAKK